MPQLPEKLRPFAAWLEKYHFWLLAAVLPPRVLRAAGGA